MTQPDFLALKPDIGGNPDRRMVGTTSMDREQYETEGWRVVKEYTREDGKPGQYWAASLEGLQRYGQLQASRRAERIAAARTRREADDAWSDQVTSDIQRYR